MAPDVADTTLVCDPSAGQSRRVTHTPGAGQVAKSNPANIFVSVIGPDRQPLWPISPGEARRRIRAGEATPFKTPMGIFCVRLNKLDPSLSPKGVMVLGIDPGSKKWGFTVKSKDRTWINILSDAVTDVKDKIKSRREQRRSRRFRKTPCRQNRYNRSKTRLPPSTRARWQVGLRILDELKKILPITDVVCEDICAETRKGQKKWNRSFHVVQHGKNWFYDEIEKRGVGLHIRAGYETKELRDNLGLKKTSNKMADSFWAHNVDSWVLANNVCGGHDYPDNTSIIIAYPLRPIRRQLHKRQPGKGGVRNRVGGSRICDKFKKYQLVKHDNLGVCLVGGEDTPGSVMLLSLKPEKMKSGAHKLGNRLLRTKRLDPIKPLAYTGFAWKWI